MKRITLMLSLMAITLSLSASAQNRSALVDVAKTVVEELALGPSAALGQPTQPANAAGDEVESKAAAKHVLDLLVAQKFSEIREMFNEEMKRGLSVEKMREVWTGVIQNVGGFKRLTDSQFARLEGYDVVAMRCEFERGFVQVRVAFDAQKKIGGLYVLPAS